MEKRRNNEGGGPASGSISCCGIKAKPREIARKPRSFNKRSRRPPERPVMDIDFNLKQILPLSRDV